MKALLSCSKPYESQNWFNVRVLGNPPQNALEVVIQIFEENLIHIKEIVALDLGWSRGEWMIKLKDTQSLLNLNSKTSLNYSRGYFMGDYQSKDSNPIQREKGLEEDKVSPKIEFIITSIFELFSNQQNEIQSVEIPIVLMGIPFHESNDKIDLNNYLFESITAQNKDLGIKSVTIKQRYKVGSAQTNDVLCHMKIDQSLIHRWDLEKTMKVTIQGWDNDGVPRPEMWPVTMRYLDECLTCGGFYHLAEDGLSTVDCDTITKHSTENKKRLQMVNRWKKSQIQLI
ncbi:hypothetical protein DFH28DRAFT_1081432 [Melampsora americana]|nr:hypothetical protein DFH28DRAFT_1081432 [Melampsora americana]